MYIIAHNNPIKNDMLYIKTATYDKIFILFIITVSVATSSFQYIINNTNVIINNDKTHTKVQICAVILGVPNTLSIFSK